METKHTPGPWSAEKDKGFSGETTWNVVCKGEGFKRFIVSDEGLYRCDGSDEANARLISAAPDLLEQLQSMLIAAHMMMAVRGLSAEWEKTGIPADARAAIAKACGETP